MCDVHLLCSVRMKRLARIGVNLDLDMDGLGENEGGIFRAVSQPPFLFTVPEYCEELAEMSVQREKRRVLMVFLCLWHHGDWVAHQSVKLPVAGDLGGTSFWS